MKARRKQLCFECGDDILPGNAVVMRTVLGERRPIHALHINLPKRHIRSAEQRWGSLRQGDPTVPNQGRGKGLGRGYSVMAKIGKDTIYLGRAYSDEQKERMLGDYYEKACDNESCHHRHCVEKRGGPKDNAAERKRNSRARKRAA